MTRAEMEGWFIVFMLMLFIVVILFGATWNALTGNDR